MTRQKICVVTGSRADYGILFPILQELSSRGDLTLQIVATGSHLSPEFGLTYREIEDDGYTITKKIEMLLSSDTPVGVAKSMGIALSEFGTVFMELNPDFVLLLGDRFELLAAACAALVAPLPIIHIHGGETTRGAFDEGIRHSITKMAHLHFTATEVYRRRVIQLGESPQRVFNSGAPGLDNLRNASILNREDVEKKVGISFNEKTVLVTWHPITLEPGQAAPQFEGILEVLAAWPELNLIFTGANADNEGRMINHMIDKFVVANRCRAVLVPSMGRQLYWSNLKCVDFVLGNSSSGIIEAPSAGIPTINIGTRQEGRIRAPSVIDCDPDVAQLNKAIRTALSCDFRAGIDSMANPYDQGGASRIIGDVIANTQAGDLLKKSFYDIKFSERAE
jgi:GDP/UDP-N,N'-diacetylbacillosamine 2-epimerase (hydrolysing)